MIRGVVARPAHGGRVERLAGREHGSTIITSNCALAEWPSLFKDDLLASAALDRLLHHAHVIEITGHSYRNPPRGNAPANRAA